MRTGLPIIVLLVACVASAVQLWMGRSGAAQDAQTAATRTASDEAGEAPAPPPRTPPPPRATAERFPVPAPAQRITTAPVSPVEENHEPPAGDSAPAPREPANEHEQAWVREAAKCPGGQAVVAPIRNEHGDVVRVDVVCQRHPEDAFPSTSP